MERGKCSMVRTATGKSASLVEMETSLKRCGTAACSIALETSRACFRSLLGKRPRARPSISGGESILNDLDVRRQRFCDRGVIGSEADLLSNGEI